MLASIWANRLVGTWRGRGVCSRVVGPVTHASARETQCGGCQFRPTEVHIGGAAPWWEMNTSYQPKHGHCLALASVNFFWYVANLQYYLGV